LGNGGDSLAKERSVVKRDRATTRTCKKDVYLQRIEMAEFSNTEVTSIMIKI
jgi:hypothetical protein